MSSVLSRAVELAGSCDLATALDEIRSSPTFELQAAYASAVRQRREPGVAAAAELLEVALLLRRRRVLSGARWYHRPELMAPLAVTGFVLHLVGNVSRYGWRLAVIVGLVAVALIATAWIALRRAHAAGGNRAAPSVGAHSRTDLVRFSDTTTAVVRLVEEREPSVDELVATADRHARGIGAPLIAVAALARAEKLLTGSVVPAHRHGAGTAAAARQQVVARERGRGADLLERAR